MAETQTHATHRRYYPLYHFVVVPLLVLNIVVRVVYAFRHAGARLVWWEVVFAVALGLFAWTARAMALRVQDRLIVLEETLRLTACAGDDIKHRVPELTAGELIALRFCDNAELDEVTRAVLAGELKGRENIKRRIGKWRPDVRPRA
jgi:hypothetical protein